MRLPTRSLAFLVGGLMLGTALAPVGAQQIAPADGQLAVRSDGAVYLIINAQRRWVPTVQITDDELNAYPEGEPIYAGLAPMGSQTTTTTARVTASPAANTASGTTGTSGTTSTGTTGTTGTTSTGTTSTTGTATTTSATRTATSTTTTSTSTGTTGTTSSTSGATSTTGATTTMTPSPELVGVIDPELPFEVDIEGPAKFEPGERMIINLKTKIGAACELLIQWPGGRESSEDNKTADSRGRCRYSIVISDNEATGTGQLKGSVRDGGRMSRQDVDFEIVPRN